MNPKLKMLCELYDRSDESIDADTLLKVCFFKDLKDVLELLTSKQQIEFCRLCAKSVVYLANESNKKDMETCLELVKEWLRNNGSYFIYKELEIINNAINKRNYNWIPEYAITYLTLSISYPTNCLYYVLNGVSCSVNAAKNPEEQEYRNLGFLVKVIRDG